MQLVKKCLGLVLVVFATLPAWAAHTQVRLLLSAETARAGDTVLAGVLLEMEPGWHTYWRNPGVTGQATTLTWELPPGVTAGTIQWPSPEKLPDPEFTTYIYNGEVVLLVPLKLNADLRPGPLDLKLKASWLECKESCILADGTAQAQLTIGTETKPSKDAALLESWQKRIPQPSPALAASARWDGPAVKDRRAFILEWNTPKPVTDADFYPDASDQWEVLGPTTNAPAASGKTALRKEIKKGTGDWPKRISGVLVQKEGGERQAYAIDVAISPSGSLTAAAPAISAQSTSLWVTLLKAFLGGLILNVMPCVLPVIALKILGFVNQAKDHPSRVRTLGLVYVLGVLVSFFALALLVLAVKAAGSAAGWGFQFGNPYFLIAMTILVTLIALNLFGVFEITLGAGTMTAASSLSSRHGATGAFFNGLLTTVLATSCSAPFMAAALGFAFSQSAAVAVLVMLTVGLGLSLPYLALSWNPRWLRLLPRPGPWMEKFKVAMGFPMLATAVWLCSLLETHYGERVWWMAAFLVCLAVAAWVFGEFIQRGTKRRVLASLFALVLLVGGYFYALEGGLRWRVLSSEPPGSTPPSYAPAGIPWEKWSPEAVAEARRAGHPVLVDFTAKWCPVCNLYVKPVLESAAVQEKLKAVNARPFLADYTKYGADITAELQRFGRAGIPLVLVYSPNPSIPPELFDGVTPGSLVAALDRAAAP